MGVTVNPKPDQQGGEQPGDAVGLRRDAATADDSTPGAATDHGHERHFEYLLIATVAGAACILHFWVEHKLIVANFFFLPVVTASLLLGKRAGGWMALFCLVLVGTSAYVQPGRYQLVVNPEQNEFHTLLFVDLVIWGAFLSLTALLVGHVPEMRARQARFEKIASVDSLTGLLNRRALTERAEQAVSQSRRHRLPLGLFMVDLDGFKQCNDTYGHDMGDQVLRQFARLLREGGRKEDLVARYGGDEFCMMLPHTGLAHARILAERLCQRWIQIPFERRGKTFHMGASFGVACLTPEDFNRRADISSEDLIRRADRAMYVAKRSGTNQVVCADPSMDELERGG